MVYQYLAYRESGEVVKGKLSAANEEAATEMLDLAGYQVISLKPFEEFFDRDKLFARWRRVKPDEIILLYRQLALLLESGLDIITSLELLRSQTSSRSLEKVLGEVISDLRGGSQLSAALDKYPQIFPPIHCRSLRVGEQTGSLETMLRHMANHMEKDLAATKGIKNALMYPIIAFIVAVAVVGVMITFVLPAFSTLYQELGVDLPAPTKILIATGEWFRSNGLYLVLGIVAGVGAAFAYIRTPDGKYAWHKLLLRLPLVGRVSHLNELARCSKNISLLFHAGLPLTEIIPLVIQSTGNTVMARAFTTVQEDMIKGEGLSRPMAKHEVFLPMMVQMVRVGEETGRLDATLLAVAENYETEAQEKTRRLIGLIQPIVTLIIGAMIAFIAVSMVSAMYSIYGQVA